uniref:Uncharacterized protein MANES_06G037900 n=1 Tax=Rhizophora mucronata TaxID=61149 RepID=A0A2P2LM17_RHIMU
MKRMRIGMIAISNLWCHCCNPFPSHLCPFFPLPFCPNSRCPILSNGPILLPHRLGCAPIGQNYQWLPIFIVIVCFLVTTTGHSSLHPHGPVIFIIQHYLQIILTITIILPIFISFSSSSSTKVASISSSILAGKTRDSWTRVFNNIPLLDIKLDLFIFITGLKSSQITRIQIFILQFRVKRDQNPSSTT